LIRRVRPEDVALYPDFLRDVSAEDLRLRFFARVAELSAAEIDKLSHVDYSHEMANAVKVLSGRSEQSRRGRASHRYGMPDCITRSAWHPPVRAPFSTAAFAPRSKSSGTELSSASTPTRGQLANDLHASRRTLHDDLSHTSVRLGQPALAET
jgi:hypothetical protein